MKRLLFVIILAGLAWSGHWFWSAHQLRQQTAAWFDARRTAGWEAQYGDLTVLGFPNRLDATLTDVTLADPATRITWQAPFLQIFRLAYKPNHLILIWPDDQTLTTATGTTRITDTGMRASLILDGDALLRSNLESESLSFAAPSGTLALAGVTGAFTHIDGPTYRLALNATGIADSAAALAAPNASGLSVDATVTFDQPLTKASLTGPRPHPVQIALRLAEYRLGAQSLKLSGDLTLDDQGLATGTLSLQATDWPQMLTLARASSGLPPALFAPLEQALTLSGNLNRTDGARDLTLRVNDGAISMGMIQLGRIPPLRLP
ncbi:DUF2125 domain-containing protein [Puniceibacterium sediminis]|uniref:DUF2125 domain-containing protein n=1 Tax=Puniceibacterium sediminis TaxID=1608407 RepID=A0A238WKR5_9RHOB|nr:DUF2125 domain-containing protein [Puniceibacterium sediminis]SNR47176.1 hypothetical protein SAMN06265370_106109 [Puniceibacterium sediminis]